jgi:ribulose-5-phosphate 4-epimerase/fuculose-1-phosphate aldolase
MNAMNSQSADRLMELKARLVVANRILYARGVVDAFGHVSHRHTEVADRFLMSRSLAPALVSRGDLQEIDFAGNVVGGSDGAPYLERHIHAAIYEMRPDVMSVVHSHSDCIIAFGISRQVRLKPVFHMAGFLCSEVPVFEIRDALGDATDLLVKDSETGRRLATTLGNAAAVLMRGHGSTVVGGSLEEAVYQAVYTEKNAEIQSRATRMGPIDYLTPQEAVAAATTNRGQIKRAYDLWAMEVSSERYA